MQYDSDAELHAPKHGGQSVLGGMVHRMFKGYAARAGATSEQSSLAQSTSAPCVPKTGVVHVKSVDGNNECGYLSGKPNQYDLKGQFSCTSQKEDALIVHASCDAPKFDLVALNLKTPYPFVGGVVGVASTDRNLNPGSPNYAYISGVEHTAFGSAAQSGGSSFTDATNITSTVESSIWTINDSSQLVPHWVNDDGTTPATSIAWFTNVNELYFTGDFSLLSGLSVEKWSEVTFTLVAV